MEVFPGALQTEQTIGGWREALVNEMDEGNVSEFQKKKASGALPTKFLSMDEKDVHRIMMEVEPLLGASGYRTRRNILMTHGKYPCHCLAQTFWHPKRGNLVLVWDMEELYSTGLPDQNKPVSIVVVSAMLAVRWLEANAGTSEQETAVPTTISNTEWEARTFPMSSLIRSFGICEQC